MRLLQLGVVWAVVVMLAGCAGSGNQQADLSVTGQGDGDPNAADIATDNALEDNALEEGAIAFHNELPEGNVDPPLLPATPPEQRVAQVTTGRPDPFSPLSSTPTVVPTATARIPSSPPALQPMPLASLPNLPPPPLSTIPIPVQASPGIPNQAPSPVSTVPTVAVAPTPPAPEPVIPAVQTVEVNGVVQVGNMTRAIVTVPNEGTGRSVSVGDRIANGQVLVKRIEIGYGGDPIVVLEQNGVEVVRSVSLTGS